MKIAKSGFLAILILALIGWILGILYLTRPIKVEYKKDPNCINIRDYKLLTNEWNIPDVDYGDTILIKIKKK